MKHKEDKMACEGNASKKPGAFSRFLSCITGGRVACDKRKATSRDGAAEGLFIVVTSDVMGRDADIGRILMKGFFETMKSTGEFPHSIFLMNAAVKLTTTDEEFVPLLKGIQDAGVELYSCGTCLKHYGLEDRLRVGHRGSTGQVIESIRDMRTVWI